MPGFDPELLLYTARAGSVRARHSGHYVALSDSFVTPHEVSISGRQMDRYVGGPAEQRWVTTVSATDATSVAQTSPAGLVLTQTAAARYVHVGLGDTYSVGVDLHLDKTAYGTPNSMTRIKVAYNKATEVVGVIVKDNGNGTLQVDKDGSFDTTNGTATLLGTVTGYKPGMRLILTRAGRALTCKVGAFTWTFQAAAAIDTSAPGVGFSVWNNNKTVLRNLVVTSPTRIPEPRITATQWRDRSPARTGAWHVPATVSDDYEIIERTI